MTEHLPGVPLSVCVPTYRRPESLEVALRSVTQSQSRRDRTELIVSDNSPDAVSEEVYRRTVQGWEGPTSYSRNLDNPGMVGNFNRCVERARGRYVLILHDDDYLRPGALETVHAAIEAAPDQPVILFGVDVVNRDGAVLRRQRSRRWSALPPGQALERVLGNSSFVRFPAIVVRRDAYAEVGPFDAELQGATDFDMWVRLFGRFGVQLVPETTAAYVVHPDAHTAGVFTRETIAKAVAVFGRARAMGVLDDATLRRCEAAWFHQFILAGAFRALRARDRRAARRVLRLFELPAVRDAGVSPRWVPARAVFRLATAGA